MSSDLLRRNLCDSILGQECRNLILYSLARALFHSLGLIVTLEQVFLARYDRRSASIETRGVVCEISLFR